MRKLKCKWVKITPLMEVSGPGAEPRPSGAEKNLICLLMYDVDSPLKATVNVHILKLCYSPDLPT